MRILAVTSEPPWPPHSGYRIRCWEILRRLASRHEVRLLCLERGPQLADRSWEAAFARVRRVRGRSTGPLTLLRSMAGDVPHHALLHDGAALRAALREEAAGCDVVLAHYLYFARALLSLPEPRPRLILDQHNLDHESWETHAEAARGPLRLWLRRQARLVRRDEMCFLPSFCTVFSVSEPDAAVTRAIAGEDVRVEVAPNGADCARLRPVERDRPGRTVLFTGTAARRNVEGLAWFLRHAWPLVRADVPQARLLVAGRVSASDLPADVRHETGVTFTGERESLQESFDQADVAIVPIRLGGGTKLKVFEALASGVPVVALSASATGTCCGERDGVLAERESTAYAAATSRLLRDVPYRLRLGAAARRHAEEAHDWGNIAERIGDVIAGSR